MFRKINRQLWPTLRSALETHYLKSRHSANSTSAYSVFLNRCRKVKDIRDMGLKYVVFIPKLTVWAEKLDNNAWKARKNEISQVQLFSEVDKMVNRHCPQWFEILRKIYPSWDLQSLPGGQPLSTLPCAPHGGINKDNTEYEPF